MKLFHTIYDALERQTRAIRWAVIALIFMAGFLFWSEVIDPVRMKWADEVTEIEQQLNEVRSASRIARDFRAYRNTILTMGRVDVPQRPEITIRRVNDVVQKIIDSRRAQITNDQFGLTTGRRLDRRDAEELLGREQIVELLQGKLEFEAEAPVVTDVLRELEMSEHIEHVGNVRLTHQGRNRVRAIISFESWVVGAGQRR